MLPTKQTNQLFLKLKDQLLLENKICEYRDDLFHLALTLLCDSCFSEDTIKSQVSILNNHLKNISEISISNIHEALALASVCEKYDYKPPSSLVIKLNKIVDEVSRVSNYPLAMMGAILYFGKTLKANIESIESLDSLLLEKGASYIHDRHVELAIDAFWGTSQPIDINIIKTFADLVHQEADELPREKLAKAILILLDWKQAPPNQLLLFLEKRIDLDFNNWIVPDILFALIESEKLINSNIPENHLESIYLTLKQAGTHWTRIVDSVTKTGIVIDLKHFMRMPAFSPSEDTLSFLALKQSDRESIYQVEACEYEKYREYLAITDKDKLISSKSVALLVVFVLLEIISWAAITIFTWDSLKSFLHGLYTQNIWPRSLKEFLALLTNPLFSAGFFIFWFRGVWKETLDKKKTSFAMIGGNIPIISRFFRG